MFNISISNTDRIPMWYLPNSKYYLNYENNELIVNEEELTAAQKKIIVNDVQKGLLVSTDALAILSPPKDEVIVNIAPQESSGVVGANFSQKAENKYPLQLVQEEREKQTQQLITLLKSKPGEIKKHLKRKSLQDLRILLEQEQNNKNRKTVITMISNLIQFKEEKISKHANKIKVSPEIEKQIIGADLAQSEQIEAIEDSEFETVELQII